MKAKGYTLIEILVALSVIGILFSFGYVSYRDFSRRQAVLGMSKTVLGDLRAAQQSALSGVKPESCDFTEELLGYNFYITSPSEYEIQAACSGGNFTNRITQIPDGIAISSTTNPILFRVLGVGTNLDENGAIITLTQGSTGNTSVITVGSGGDIK